MKRFSFRSTALCALLLLSIASMAQVNQIVLQKSGRMDWGVNNYVYGPAQKNFWWNLDKCQGIVWQQTKSVYSYGTKHLNASMLYDYPHISGTRDTVEFRNGNLYEDLYMKNLYLHTTTATNAVTEPQQAATQEALLQLQPQKVSVGDSLTTYCFSIAALEAAFPTAVHTDEYGQKGVDYGALLPILLCRIEELKAQIEEQQKILESLQTADAVPLRKAAAGIGATAAAQSVTFELALPKHTQTARVQLCDASGQQIRIEDVTASKRLTVTLDELPDGEGYYSLMADGKLVELKKISLK